MAWQAGCDGATMLPAGCERQRDGGDRGLDLHRQQSDGRLRKGTETHLLRRPTSASAIRDSIKQSFVGPN